MVLTLAGASAACGVGEPPAIERVQVVVGGFRVAGHGDGTVLARTFDDSCAAPVFEAGDAAPIVGAAGSSITLAIAVPACASADGAPARLSWEIEGTELAGEGARSAGQTVVTLPSTTGLYRLLIRDTTNGGGAQPLDLVVLLGAPVGPFASTPASAAVYRAAGRWGAGFTAGSAATDVLRQMVGRIYEHGREHWSYGYADKDGNCFAFNGTVVGCEDPPGSLRVACSPTAGCQESGRICDEHGACDQVELVCTPGDTMCKCSWEELLDADSPCHFSDCFTMAELLASLGAVLGVDGIQQQTLRGSDGHGFLTHPELRAFDPEFVGNADCRGNECAGYLFSAHQVAFLPDDGGDGGGLFFDPTFGRVYEHADEPVALMIRQDATIPAGPQGTDLRFTGSTLRLCQLAAGYATWPSFARQAPGTGVCPLDPARPARLGDTVALAPLDPDGDGEVDGVAIDVDVQLTVAGKYRIGAVLLDADTGDAHAPPDATTHPVSATVDGAPGTHKARLVFKHVGSDHGHHLRLYAFSQAGRSDAISAGILAAPEGTFEPGASLRKIVVHGTDPEPSTGAFENLRVSLELDGAAAGAYQLVATLRHDGGTVTRSEESVTLGEGSVSTAVELAGAAIRASGIDAPYGLHLRLQDSTGATVLEANHTVCCHAATDFASGRP